MRCVRIVSPTGEQVDTHPSVHIGGEYLALEVYASQGRPVRIRVADDAGGVPGLWEATMFVTVDGRIPPNWTAHIDDRGVRFAPTRWHEPGFWEQYCDGDTAAIAVFEREVALMNPIG